MNIDVTLAIDMLVYLRLQGKYSEDAKELYDRLQVVVAKEIEERR